MQALCTCWECGTTVRRDDGPLAPPSEQPKRLLFSVGSGALLTLDFCNDCFTSVLGGAQSSAVMRGSRRHALTREGGEYAAGPTEATYPTSTTGPTTKGPTEAVYEAAYPSGPSGPSVVRAPLAGTTGDRYPAGPAGPSYVAFPAGEGNPVYPAVAGVVGPPSGIVGPPGATVVRTEELEDIVVEGVDLPKVEVAGGDEATREEESWRGRDDP